MSRKPIMTRRVRRHEEHTNHEAWAIPYGDLITLLLAFFVVMYAISSVNAGKYRVLSDSLFAAFRGTPRTMEPIQVGEKQQGSGTELESAVIQSQLRGQPSSLAPVPVQGGTQQTGTSPVANRLPAQARAPGVSGTQAAGAPGAAALARVADEVARAMNDLVKQNLVIMRRTDFWIEVEIKTDILFPSGSAQLAPYAVDVIERLGGALAPFPNPIRVEGHTDNKPIKTRAFYSNWELSAARAGSVVRVLQGRGVNPERLAVIGYGEQRPIQSNDTEQGRNANRRVVVVILSTELQRRADPAEQAAGSAAPPAPNPMTSGATPVGIAPILPPSGATPIATAPIPPASGATPIATAPIAPASTNPTATPPGTAPLPATATPTRTPAGTAVPVPNTPAHLPAPASASLTSPPQAHAALASPGEPAALPTAHAAPAAVIWDAPTPGTVPGALGRAQPSTPQPAIDGQRSGPEQSPPRGPVRADRSGRPDAPRPTVNAAPPSVTRSTSGAPMSGNGTVRAP